MTPRREAVDVLGEILRWSLSLPGWQRDALRRLVVRGTLGSRDIDELTALCKSAHGLTAAEVPAAAPLTAQHIPQRRPGSDAVALVSVTHHRGVNALAEGQTIEFGAGLTVVYGPNAAGKSGYTRILKRACRARGAEEILANVFAQSAPVRPSATIRYRVGEAPDEFAWTDQDGPHENLSHVSVFDTHCATVYLRKETDVAFRPFGLDLFDALADVCLKVQRTLAKERRDLEEGPTALPNLSQGTVAQRIVASITSLTPPEAVKKVATLTNAEREQLGDVRRRLRDLDAEDPQKAAARLELRAGRLEALATHLSRILAVVGDDGVRSLADAARDARDREDAARTLYASAFPSGLLQGSGTETWRTLWEAARHFSNERAYTGRQFPVTEKGALCVLCQQPIAEHAAARLQHFEQHLRSTLQQQADRARSELRTLKEAMEALSIEGAKAQVAELQLEQEELAQAVTTGLAVAAERQSQIITAFAEGRDLSTLPLAYLALPVGDVQREVGRLRERSQTLRQGAHPAVRERLIREYNELAAREQLNANLAAVLGEIERKKTLAAYLECLKDTNTRDITTKSTDLTKRAVTGQLAQAFLDELQRLRFSHLEVQLEPVRGERGALYHRLVLRRAPGMELTRVVSEGEARTIAIAAFFAELSTAADPSAVLFDDPVSSLDHEWRENVALRLATAARSRQVIVFTHDIVFVLALAGKAEELEVAIKHQYVRRESLGAGIASAELPWVAMKTRERIGMLRQRFQAADKIFRTEPRTAYEREAILIYGLLRETWERALEEVLLGGVVERYRRSIQTQQVHRLSDITDDDCKVLEEGMTKCSRWLPGHDQAAAENVPVPEPAELSGDVESLAGWVDDIRNRRR